MVKKYLEIGKIVGTHGIRGELRVEFWSDSAEFYSKFKKLYFNKGKEKITVKSRPHKKIALTKIEGIDTINEADLLRGKILYVDRDEIELEENVYFIQDLIGLTIIDMNTKEVYGKIKDVIETGSNDVYIIKNEEEKEYLIPVIEEVVKKIDMENKEILIVPMEGIFED